MRLYLTWLHSIQLVLREFPLSVFSELAFWDVLSSSNVNSGMKHYTDGWRRRFKPELQASAGPWKHNRYHTEQRETKWSGAVWNGKGALVTRRCHFVLQA
ncbi:hypothetical protein ILYODFUR_007142 [Ilyodon furcidens]|uniref:Uncharacterized protein n=1 Tax=Ilyodon furcidens TaxID=33524 RepID=A0ABV0UI46_9TELE